MLIFVVKTQLTWWLTTALLLYYRGKHVPILKPSRVIE
jgi:hypothetical protein